MYIILAVPHNTWDLSFLIKNWTLAPCIESVEFLTTGLPQKSLELSIFYVNPFSDPFWVETLLGCSGSFYFISKSSSLSRSLPLKKKKKKRSHQSFEAPFGSCSSMEPSQVFPSPELKALFSQWFGNEAHTCLTTFSNNCLMLSMIPISRFQQH